MDHLTTQATHCITLLCIILYYFYMTLYYNRMQYSQSGIVVSRMMQTINILTDTNKQTDRQIDRQTQQPATVSSRRLY